MLVVVVGVSHATAPLDLRERLALDGAAPAGGTPAALAAYHKADYEKWGKVITTGKIRGN